MCRKSLFKSASVTSSFTLTLRIIVVTLVGRGYSFVAKIIQRSFSDLNLELELVVTRNSNEVKQRTCVLYKFHRLSIHIPR